MNYHIEYYLIISSIFVCGALGDMAPTQPDTRSYETLALNNYHNSGPKENVDEIPKDLPSTTSHHPVMMEELNEFSDPVSMSNDIDADAVFNKLKHPKDTQEPRQESQSPPQPLSQTKPSDEINNNVVPGTVLNIKYLEDRLPLQLLNNNSNVNSTNENNPNHTRLLSNAEVNATIMSEEQSFLQWFTIMHKITEGELKNKNANIYVIYFINLVLCSVAIMGMILGLFKCYRPRQWLLHTFLKDFRRMINADQLKV